MANDKAGDRRRASSKETRGAAAPDGGRAWNARGDAKVLAAFRIPKSLYGTMTQESRDEGLDLTGYVNRLFDGFLHYFGLPGVIRENLERDREALGLGRYEYLQYVLYRRHEAVAQQGEGFDRTPARRK